MPVSQVASAATSTQLLPPNSGRKAVSIYNTDANALYVIVDSQAATSALHTVKLNTDDYWESPPAYSGQEIRGIWAGDGSGHANITEYL